MDGDAGILGEQGRGAASDSDMVCEILSHIIEPERLHVVTAGDT
jgi:hypothetical protein